MKHISIIVPFKLSSLTMFEMLVNNKFHINLINRVNYNSKEL